MRARAFPSPGRPKARPGPAGQPQPPVFGARPWSPRAQVRGEGGTGKAREGEAGEGGARGKGREGVTDGEKSHHRSPREPLSVVAAKREAAGPTVLPGREGRRSAEAQRHGGSRRQPLFRGLLKNGKWAENLTPEPPGPPFVTRRRPDVPTLGGGQKSRRSGLGSADRNNKATLPLTPPVRTTKSSAKDLSPRAVKLQFAGSTPGLPPGDGRRPAQVRGQRPIRIRLRRAGEDHPFLAWILT